MAELLGIANVENVVDPIVQRLLFDLSSDLKKKQDQIEKLTSRIDLLEEQVKQCVAKEEKCIAVFGNNIMEVPFGMREAIVQTVLPLFIEASGMSKEQQQKAIANLVAVPGELKKAHERHPVWGTPDHMRLQFEERLEKLLEKGDLDNDGFISRQEFKQIVIDHFRYRVEAQDGEALHPKDLNKLEKRAYRMFKKFDKDNNKKLDIHELRNYLLKQINDDDEEDIIEQTLFL